jgi:hypothetical protein
MNKRFLATLAALSLVAIIGASPVAATATTEFIPGNPACDGTKIDPVAAGTYALAGGGHIVITLGAGNTFSFDTEGSATVSSITVKGGPNALLWTFDPPVESATGLHAPENPNNGKWYGLSQLWVNSENKFDEGGN